MRGWLRRVVGFCGSFVGAKGGAAGGGAGGAGGDDACLELQESWKWFADKGLAVGDCTSSCTALVSFKILLMVFCQRRGGCMLGRQRNNADLQLHVHLAVLIVWREPLSDQAAVANKEYIEIKPRHVLVMDCYGK